MAKSSFEETVKRQSLATLLGAAALVLVVGVVAGFGIGYKVEQERTKDDVKEAKARAASNANANGDKKNQQANAAPVQVIGKVDTSDPAAVTVTMNDKSSKKLTVNTGTLYVKAVEGTAADIVKDSRVVWKPKAGSMTAAEEVVVLPGNTSRIGRLVTAADADSMTIKANNGKDVEISIDGATVHKVEAAKQDAVAKGATVIAQTRKNKSGASIATQIIVLPSGTKFV